MTRTAGLLAALVTALLPMVMFAGPAALAAPSVPALSGPSAAMVLQINGSQVTCIGPGMSAGCNITVDLSATVTNLTAQDLSVSDMVTGVATYGPPGAGRSASGTFTWPGEANGYGLVPPGSSITGTGSATFTFYQPEQGVPGPDSILTLNFQVYPGTYPNLGTAETISATVQYTDSNGVPLPTLLNIGGAVTAAILGGMLALKTSRRRRLRAEA